MSMTFSAAAKSVVDLDNKKSPVEVLGVLSKSQLLETPEKFGCYFVTDF